MNFQISFARRTIHKLNPISSVKLSSAKHETERKKKKTEKEKRSTPGAAALSTRGGKRREREKQAREVSSLREVALTRLVRIERDRKGAQRGKEARALFSRPAWMLN